MKWLLPLLLIGCARQPEALRTARQHGLARQGAPRASELHLLALDVHRFADPPRTLDGTVALPALAELDDDALIVATTEAWLAAGGAFGLTVHAEDAQRRSWEGLVPDGMPGLLATVPSEQAGATLQVSLGWCVVAGAAVPCVRSQDSALGYGPPGTELVVYRRLRERRGTTFARRSSVTYKGYTLVIDPETGAQQDRPFLGQGDTAQEQAEDALAQAVRATLAAYQGRRRLRRLNR